MNTIDIIISVLLLFGLVRGIMKGLIVELVSLVALVGGSLWRYEFFVLRFRFIKKLC